LLHSLTSNIEALQVVEHALDRIQTRTQHKLRFISLCSIIPGYVVEQQCSQMVEICRLLETERDLGEFTLDDKDPQEPKRPEVERLISLQLEQKNKEELIMIDADFRNTETFKSATQLRELRKEAEVRDSVKKKQFEVVRWEHLLIEKQNIEQIKKDLRKQRTLYKNPQYEFQIKLHMETAMKEPLKLIEQERVMIDEE